MAPIIPCFRTCRFRPTLRCPFGTRPFGVHVSLEEFPSLHLACDGSMFYALCRGSQNPGSHLPRPQRWFPLNRRPGVPTAAPSDEMATSFLTRPPRVTREYAKGRRPPLHEAANVVRFLASGTIRLWRTTEQLPRDYRMLMTFLCLVNHRNRPQSAAGRVGSLFF